MAAPAAGRLGDEEGLSEAGTTPRTPGLHRSLLHGRKSKIKPQLTTAQVYAAATVSCN